MCYYLLIIYEYSTVFLSLLSFPPACFVILFFCTCSLNYPSTHSKLSYLIITLSQKLLQFVQFLLKGINKKINLNALIIAHFPPLRGATSCSMRTCNYLKRRKWKDKRSERKMTENVQWQREGRSYIAAFQMQIFSHVRGHLSSGNEMIFGFCY